MKDRSKFYKNKNKNKKQNNTNGLQQHKIEFQVSKRYEQGQNGTTQKPRS